MGGNVFDNCKSIKLQNILPTFLKLKEELSILFPDKSKTFDDIEFLGSVGKKDVSGDIDLGYDVKNLFVNKKLDFESWNINKNEFEDLYYKIKNRARTATDNECKIRTIIELISDYISFNSNLIFVNKKGSNSHSIFMSFPQFSNTKKLNDRVQIDFNIGPLDWLLFSYYSEDYSENIKGLHRTQLVLSLFVNKDRIFKHSNGVIHKKTKIQEASTPEQAIKLLNLLYKFKMNEDIIKNYFKLFDYINHNMKKEELNNIFDIYLKILDSTRADIPFDLQDYWIKNQTRLKLSGKFLPQNSELNKYKIDI